MSTIRIAGFQMIVSQKLEDNLPRILDYVKKSDADFIVFPEMSLTSYNGQFGDKATRKAWPQIKTVCRQAYVVALVGTGCKTEEGTFIQTRIASDEGTLVGTHEKLVPTLEDREFCRPGEELRVFESRGLTFGCLIGNDLWVAPGFGPYPDPRLSYQLGEKGAQVIFHANRSGTDPAYSQYYESNLMLRAREAGAYIVTVNTAEEEGPVNVPSGIVSPEGEWLTQCPLQDDQMFTLDIEVVTD